MVSGSIGLVDRLTKGRTFVTGLRVWIDQDLCTGDGLCVDHCPEVFVLLEDGISYVHDGDWIGNEPGQSECEVVVATNLERAVVAAAEDCPGECIFIEVDEAVPLR
jgi:ferredoxin